MKKSLKWQIAGAFLAIYLAWGSTYLAIGIAVKSIPPFLIGGIRFFVAGLIMILWGKFKKIPWPEIRHWFNASILGFLLLVCGNGAVIWTEQRVPSGIASLLVALVPIYIAVIAWVKNHKEKPTSLGILGLLLGVLGVGVLVNPWATENTVLIGDAILLLAGSLCWAVGSLYSRHLVLPKSSIMSIGLQMFTGGLIFFFVSLFATDFSHLSWSQITPASVWSVIYLIVGGSLIGFSSYIWLFKHVSPEKVATYAYVNPVVAVFLGWAISNEPFTRTTFLATALIVVAVALITLSKKKLHKPLRVVDPAEIVQEHLKSCEAKILDKTS